MLNDNPFFLGKYAKAYFCDREAETALLKNHMENGRNVVLAANRRLGKTGLILHLMNQPDVQENFYCFYFDAFPTESLERFTFLLCQTVLEEANRRQGSWLTKLKKAISSVSMQVTVDDNLQPTLSIGYNAVKTPELSLRELFAFLNGLDRPAIIAIDEFQQVAQYQDKTAEALIRSYAQQAPNVRLIYSGSRCHMLSEMFLKSNRPFFQSAVFMNLDPIPENVYRDFSQMQFRRAGKTLPEGLFHDIYAAHQGVTWYVHYYLNVLFSLTEPGETASLKHLSQARAQIAGHLEQYYAALFAGLTDYQKAVLLSIAKDGHAAAVTSQDFCTRHGLGSVSSIQSALRRLASLAMVMKQDDGSWRVEDFFFQDWLTANP